MDLKDYIIVEKGIIPSHICNDIVSNIKDRKWTKHQWSNNIVYDTKELSVCRASTSDHLTIKKYFQQVIDSNFPDIVSSSNYLRFNRYDVGTLMRKHYDHIQSLFDGEKRGIPVLSGVVNLNSDYKGADLCFWDDYIISLGTGDVVVWPSLFLYPHFVTECTEGERFSGVIWFW